jgi:hypothetical protein
MIDEFGIMQRIASEPAGQEWRLFLLPVLSDEQLQQMRLFVRNNQEDDHEDEKTRETRFVIEVTFSRLGPFQFDGLARPKALEEFFELQSLRDSGLAHEEGVMA